jgi:PAT family beta-lactamase induction signal transducer AmpG
MSFSPVGDRRRSVPAWIFFFLAAPFGAFYWGISTRLIPYLLRKGGTDVTAISHIVAIAGLPMTWGFLMAPLVDLGLRRRTWVLAGAGAVAVCALLAILGVNGSVAAVTALLLTGVVANGLRGSASGTLMASMPPHLRGSAAGWSEAGGIGLGAVAGGGLIWLAQHTSLPVLALVAAGITFAGALAVLRVPETPHPPLAMGPLLRELVTNVRQMVWSRRALFGTIFFLSPVGAGGVGSLITSVGPDYHASGDIVALVSGLGGGLAMGLGCLIGGPLSDRMDRMRAYALFGILQALAACWLWFAPHTAFHYGAGYLTYAFATGLGFATFSALVLDVVGSGMRGAAFAIALFSSFGNAPVLYMIWLDGAGYKAGGVAGLMRTDALVQGLAAVVLFALAPYFVRMLEATERQPDHLRAAAAAAS